MNTFHLRQLLVSFLNLIKFLIIIIHLGEENLVDRIARMGSTNPLWVDVTWRAGEGLCESTIDLCSYITKYMGLDVLMHITCTGMTREYIIDALKRAKEAGV